MALNNEMRTRLRERVEEADMELSLNSNSANPLKWAKANISYAEALFALGDEEDQPVAFFYYQEAVQAFEKALSVYKKKENLVQWGAASIDLARLLRSYGHREGGEQGVFRLQRAVNLIQDVYKAFKKQDKFSEYFEPAQLYLESGYSYQALALTDRLERKPAHLDKALAFFRKAAKFFQKKEQFEYWASAFFTIATTLVEYAKLKKSPENAVYLEDAITHFTGTLNYFENTDRYFEVFQTLKEIGLCHLFLHTYQPEEEKYLSLLKAEACFKKADSALSLEKNAKLLIRVKFNNEWAEIFSLLANCKACPDPLIPIRRAIALYQENVSFLVEEGDKINYSLVMGYLGKAYTTYANLALSEEKYSIRVLALETLQQAVSRDFKKSRPTEWLENFIELGSAYHALAHMEQGKKSEAYFLKACEYYENACKNFSKKENLSLWSCLKQWQGFVFFYLSVEVFSQKATANEYQHYLEKAKICLEEALGIAKQKEFSPDNVQLYTTFAKVLWHLGQKVEEKEAKNYYEEAQLYYNKALRILISEGKEQEWLYFIDFEIKILTSLLVYNKSAKDKLLSHGRKMEKMLEKKEQNFPPAVLLLIQGSLLQLYTELALALCPFKEEKQSFVFAYEKAKNYYTAVDAYKTETMALLQGADLLDRYQELENSVKVLKTSPFKNAILSFWFFIKRNLKYNR